jgi:hypothetical protein
MGNAIPKEWVVMIYLAADNNLGEEGVWTLTELSKVRLKSHMKVVVLFDSSGIGVDTKIYEFLPPNPAIDSQGESIAPVIPTKHGLFMNTGKPFAEWAEVEDTEVEVEDASSPELLKTFLQKVTEKYPDHDYALVLSGHGSGAVGDFLKSGKDNLAGSDYQGMTIPILGEALTKANVPIEILGMDSCLMSMAEVFYELPETVKCLIGSEGFEPLTGWPYQEMLKAIIKAEDGLGKQLALEEIAPMMRDTYIRYYAEYQTAGTSVDMSVCTLSPQKKIALQNAVNTFVEKLEPKLAEDKEIRDAVILAHWRAQSYKGEQYTDLWDFCDLLEVSLAGKDTLAKACRDVKKAIDDLADSNYHGAAFQHSHGVSVYFPWREAAELLDYEKLEFAEKSGWGNFLKRYVDLTRREKRGESRSEQGEYDKKFVFSPTSFSGSEEGITPIHKNNPPYTKNNPPYTKNNPPYTKNNPPYTKNNPPYTKNNPPYTKNNPPYTKGELAAMSGMKNPPNGFLVDEQGQASLVAFKEEE